jgi:DNA-binding NarL/FixJ family response regulator
MIRISLINKDKNQAINFKKLISEKYYVSDIYDDIGSLITSKLSKSDPTVVIYCNDEVDDFVKLIRTFKKTNVILYNNLENDKLLIKAINSGIKCFVHHTQSIYELLDVVGISCIGGTYTSHFINNKLLEYIKEATNFIFGKKIPNYPTLTRKEEVVFELLLLGFSYNEIAQTSSISVNTIRKHISRIYKKLKIHSRGELINLYFNSRFKEFFTYKAH